MAKRRVQFQSFYSKGDDAISVFRAGLEDYVDSFSRSFGECLSACQSPIEELFLSALSTRMRVEFGCYFLPYRTGMQSADHRSALVTCVPQVRVGRYTVDFLITDYRGEKPKVTIVECDGHDFHERTKEQARHDRSRDRSFTAQGIAVLRFTGSEIYADPFAVADEVASWLARTAG